MKKEAHFLGKAGERYLNFAVAKVLDIEELHCRLYEIVHLPSGAHIMHLANDDPENLFCLSFRTLPSSSNGVPHILEHTVLCGSRRFPVKDPFFSMGRRSLNTYMNALTGSDFTCYPAASQVEKDFYNLLDVYLDAVFHPQLKRESFLQEGHRLEFAQPLDPHSTLEIKGIVFNEMKGSLASGDTRLWHAMMALLVPDLTYAFNSGGDPKEIPNLTYSELIAFHETYYHPSRCLFFFYGNLPLKKHLDFLEEKILNSAQKASPIPPIPKQVRFSAPKQHEMSYPMNQMQNGEERTMVAFGWLTASLLQQDEMLALTVLDAIWMESDASPLKHKLLEAELCVHVDAFMDTEMSEAPYVIIFKGCNPKDADALEKLLHTALKQVVDEGIPTELIDAAIHQLELSRLEIAGDHAPFGLTLFMRSGLAKQQGCDPENALQIHALFEKLLSKIRDPNYFTRLIQTYFLDNRHYVRLVMRPDTQLATKEAAEEKKHLQELKKTLSESQLENLVKQAKDLKDYQKATEEQSIDCLPKVTLDDVPLLTRDFTLKTHAFGGLEVFHHDCFTNHIIYAELLFDLPSIADEDLPYVSLLATLLTEIGSKDRTYTDNLAYIQAHTGGIAAAASLFIQATDPNQVRPAFSLRGKALFRKADKLFSLMHDTLVSPRFNDPDRISDLIEQLHEAQIQRLSRQAMRYAIQLASSGSCSASYVGEAWAGLRYFKTIEALSQNLSSTIPKLIERLIALKNHLFTFHNPHLILSGSKEMLDFLTENRFFGLADLKSSHVKPWQLDYPFSPPPSQGRAIASPVAFSAEVFEAVPYIHPHSAALAATAVLLENKILHKEIRERGGAYGSGASFSPNTGHFTFHAFRDPHIARTRAVFHSSLEEIGAGHFTPQDLEEAKLGVIQQLDLPISPGSRAMTAYGWLRKGKTLAMRQQFRDRLLALTPQDISQSVTLHLLSKKETSVFVTFAGTDLLEKENKLLHQEGKSLAIFPL